MMAVIKREYRLFRNETQLTLRNKITVVVQVILQAMRQMLWLSLITLVAHVVALKVPLPDDCVALCQRNNVASSTLAFETVRNSDCSSFFVSRNCKLPLETAQDTVAALDLALTRPGLSHYGHVLETDDADTSTLLQQVPILESPLESTAQSLSFSFNDVRLGVFAFDSLVSSVKITTVTPLEELRLPNMRVGTVSVKGDLRHAKLSGSVIELANSVSESLKLDLSHTRGFTLGGANPNMTVPAAVNVTVIPSKGILSSVNLNIASPFAADANVGHLVKSVFCAPEMRLAPRTSVRLMLYHDDVLPSGLPNETYTNDMREGLQCLATRLASDATESVKYRLEMKSVSTFWNDTNVVAAWRNFFEETFLQPLESMSPSLPSTVQLVYIPPGAQVLLDNVPAFHELSVTYQADTSGWPDASLNELSGVVSASKATQLDKIKIYLAGQNLKQMANGASNLDLRLCSLNIASVLDWSSSTSNICPLLASVFESFEDAQLASPDELATENCDSSYWDQFLQRTAGDTERRNCRVSFNSETGLSVALKPVLSTTVTKYRQDADVASVTVLLKRFDSVSTLSFVALDSETSEGIECRLTGTVGNGTVLQHTVPVNTTSGECNFELPGLSKATRLFDVEMHVRNTSASGTFAKLYASTESRTSQGNVANQLDLQRRGDLRNGNLADEDTIVFSVGIATITKDLLFSTPANYMSVFDNKYVVNRTEMSSPLLQALEVDVHLPDGVIVTLQPEQCIDDNQSSFQVGRFCLYKLTSQHGLDLLGSHKSLCDTPSNQVVVHMPRLHTLADLPGSGLALRTTVVPPSAVEVLNTACPERERGGASTTPVPTSTSPGDDVPDAALSLAVSLVPALLCLLSLLH
ncbi:MAG: hypothetical protein MHM6MM_003354 [Cercozoa sp. M6MM]